MKLVRRAFGLLSPQERRTFAGVALLATTVALTQIAGIGSIIPFVALLLDPEMVERHEALALLYGALGFAEPRSFLLFTGLVALAILVIGNALGALSVYATARFQWHTQHRLANRLLAYYLSQPYAAFLQRNSAEATRNILFVTTSVVCGILAPFVSLLIGVLTTVLLAGFLFWLNPWVTVVSFVVFGCGYAIVYRLVRGSLDRIGLARLDANHQRLKTVAEAFASIKVLKISGREQAVLDRYEPAGAAVAHAAVLGQTLGPLPRYVIEVLAFGLLIGALLVLLYTGADMRHVLPLGAAFAFAGLRLVPALQAIYGALGTLRLDAPALDVIDVDYATQMSAATAPVPAPLPFARELRLEDVAFTYPGAITRTLDGVSLTIRQPSFVAFVGRTGAGKTTLADVILGLLQPQGGRITVDGEQITAANRRAWQANIGYVPQDVVLTDDTIAANVAFCIPPRDVDITAVERATRIAGIHDFIGTLPARYETVVGERGVRLSGGQRQRIGLARALYHDPAVLVLDEATSALDHETESIVHGALLSAAKAKTVILIAHRFTTVRACDCIFVLDAGRLVAQGRYEELLQSSTVFRRLAAGDAPEPARRPA